MVIGQTMSKSINLRQIYQSPFSNIHICKCLNSLILNSGRCVLDLSTRIYYYNRLWIQITLQYETHEGIVLKIDSINMLGKPAVSYSIYSLSLSWFEPFIPLSGFPHFEHLTLSSRWVGALKVTRGPNFALILISPRTGVGYRII
jgi:hypothetical protein